MTTKSFSLAIALLGLLMFGDTASAVICTPSSAKDAWAGTVRTGKSWDQPSLLAAQSGAYASLLKNLEDAGKKCIEDRKGNIVFGSSITSSGAQDANTGYWATFVMEVGCCVQEN